MKSYDLGYIHSIPGRFYTGMKTMGESSARKRFMQTLYIANLQPFKTLTAAQLPSCFDMSAKLKNWGKVYGYDPKTNSQITDIWWTEQMQWCRQKNIIAQCMSSAFWGVYARKTAKNICSYQLKMLRQSGKNYEERRREGKDFNKLEKDKMNEQI